MLILGLAAVAFIIYVAVQIKGGGLGIIEYIKKTF